jgi:hypothetical protein
MDVVLHPRFADNRLIYLLRKLAPIRLQTARRTGRNHDRSRHGTAAPGRHGRRSGTTWPPFALNRRASGLGATALHMTAAPLHRAGRHARYSQRPCGQIIRLRDDGRSRINRSKCPGKAGRSMPWTPERPPMQLNLETGGSVTEQGLCPGDGPTCSGLRHHGWPAVSHGCTWGLIWRSARRAAHLCCLPRCAMGGTFYMGA